jgi:hypothetical protein
VIGWLLFGASAFAAGMWGNWFAVGNAVANFWSLGVMSNHGPANAPIQSNGERFAVAVNAVTSLIGLGMLAAAIAVR